MKKPKTYLYSFGVILLAIGFAACNKCAKKVGNISEKTVQLSSFQNLRITGDFKIKLIQDSSFTLKINGGEGIIENVFSEIVNDTLRIENQNKCNFLSNYSKNISLEIGVGTLRQIHLTNPGSLDGLSGIISDSLLIELRECGIKMNIDGDIKKLILNIYTGTPTIYLTGKSNYFKIDESSFGHINAFDFRAKKIYITSRGTGLINLTATNELKATLMGSGIIRYRGNPTVVEIDIEEYSSAEVIKD